MASQEKHGYFHFFILIGYWRILLCTPFHLFIIIRSIVLFISFFPHIGESSIQLQRTSYFSVFLFIILKSLFTLILGIFTFIPRLYDFLK